MADWLLLRLPRAANDAAEWLVCDAQGLASTAALHGTLAEASAQTTGRKVAVLVSAADVLCTQIELPPKAGARALQMARYALEEQLLGDLDAQHFAIARRGNDSRTAVAVVARAQLQEWLDSLEAAGIHADLMCPDAALLPVQPMQTLAWIDGDLLTLVPQRPLTQAGMGSLADALVGLPANDPASALGLASGNVAMIGIDLTVYATPADWSRFSSSYEALRPLLGGLHVHLLGGGALPWLAPQLRANAPLNLLQNGFESRRSSAEWWPRWRLAAALAAALLLLHVGDRFYTLAGLRRAETTADATLKQLGEQALPGVTIKVDTLRKQVQDQLAASASQDAGLMLRALQTLAHALGKDGRLRALSFRDGNTEMQLRAKDVQTLERVKQSLLSDGLNADLVGGAAGAGGAYEGRIQIKSGGRT